MSVAIKKNRDINPRNIVWLRNAFTRMVKAITIPLSIVRFHQTFNPRYVRLRSLHVPFKPTFFASKEAWNGVCGLSLSREKRRPPVFLDKGRASTSPSLVTNRFADYSRWQISQRSLSLSLSFFFHENSCLPKPWKRNRWPKRIDQAR